MELVTARRKAEIEDIFVIHNIVYLQGKTADKSPPPQALPARAAKLLGNVITFYNAHYPPVTQGKKSYTDPRTGGPTCKTNEIIYDAIYASLPDDCKLTFAQMFSNFDDLCPFKAPLYVNGKKIDFEKHVLNLLTDTERVEWWHLTVIHLKWKYIDAIKSRVQEAIVLVFGRLPKSIGRLSTRKLCRWHADTSFIPRSVWWSSRSRSLLAIISHRCVSVEMMK